ncbi:MAG: peroxidase family protein [Bacteroidota bacterium]
MKRRLLLLMFFTGWSMATAFSQDSNTTVNEALYRTISGANNNTTNTDWGAAGANLQRFSPVGYADGISTPGGDNRPNPRELSNLIFSQDGLLNDVMGLSDFCWVFGQFIDHDIGLTPDGNEAAMINVPAGDPWFDPMNTGNVIIPMVRNVFDPNTGTSIDNPRQHPNLITAFIDGSAVYGSDDESAAWLRSFNGGRLKVSAGNLLPYNTIDGEYESEVDANSPHMDDAVGVAERLFVAGDPRANENPLLASFHTLFVREHNRLCDELVQLHPDWNDEQLYQHARKLVGAFIQSIVYNEWLPVMGVQLDEYQGYNPDVNPQLFNEFTAAAFRLGHTLLNGNILVMDNQGQLTETLGLRDAFFQPDVLVQQGGIEPFLKGMGTQVQQTFDARIIDDVRNFLFGPPGAGGLDLAAININRGRERGLTDFNSMRAALGLPKYFFFQQMNWDYNVLIKMVRTYKNINKVDPWVGMLVERPRPGELFGQTLMAVMEKQFAALRDGDRFYYLNDPVLSDEEKEAISNTRFYDILMRNADLDVMQYEVFRATSHSDICTSPFTEVRGNFFDLFDKPIAGVNVRSTDGAYQAYSDLSGAYDLGEMPGCETFDFTASMIDEPLKGISTLDMILVQKHIMGVEPLTSPYQMLAADVDRSKTISTADLLKLKKVILGYDTNIAEDEWWTFLPQGYEFEDPTDPFKEKLPEIFTMEMEGKEMQENFIGFKLGDIDFSSVSSGLSRRSAENELVLQFEDRLLKAGTVATIQFNVADEEAIRGMQLSLMANEDYVTINSVGSVQLDNFSDQDYHIGRNGNVTLAWFKVESKQIDPLTAVFEIEVDVKANVSVGDVLNISYGINAEAYDNDLNTRPVQLEAISESIKEVEATELVLYQNIPNPYIQNTKIAFSVLKAETVKLNVYDQLGRLIHTAAVDATKGYNEYILDGDAFEQTGVLTYQIETTDGVVSRQMIKL